MSGPIVTGRTVPAPATTVTVTLRPPVKGERCVGTWGDVYRVPMDLHDARWVIVDEPEVDAA